MTTPESGYPRNRWFLMSSVLLALFFLAGVATDGNTPIPAFPGAEGAGMWAVGGRGGTVYEVTNLNDSGPGSLRAAVAASGPRIVVFRLSGTIKLQSTLNITNPYITIAGQTAPGGGICLRDYGLSVRADNVIVRYIRCRPGDNMGKENDGINVTAGKNIIIDHCSTSWAVDETFSVTTSPIDVQLGNVTVQWCMITESLNCSIHSKGCHGYGSLVRGGFNNKYSFHHNLYAHHKGRNPRPGNYNSYAVDPCGLIFDFRNNVVYNWGGSKAGNNEDSNSITRMNFIGNYYKRGSNSTGSYAFSEKCTYDRAYFSGNWMSSYGGYPADPWSLVKFGSASTPALIAAFKLSSPIPVEPATTDDAVTAYNLVLADAGATLPVRDAVDVRVINDVINGTGRIIDDEDEVGGWPVLESTTPPADTDHDGMPDGWELKQGLDPEDLCDGPKDADGDGYTNVEEYLNYLTESANISSRIKL